MPPIGQRGSGAWHPVSSHAYEIAGRKQRIVIWRTEGAGCKEIAGSCESMGKLPQFNCIL